MMKSALWETRGVLLTKSGQYALGALIYIAEHGAAGPARTGQIAEALGVPRNYLSKLLHQLARAGVLRSERGPRGGFSLARPAGGLSLQIALAPIEADRLAASCLLGRAQCTDDDPCPVHEEWRDVREKISHFLQATTIADLVRDRRGAKP